MSREIKTAHEMYLEVTDMINGHMVKLRDETANLIEAWSIAELDDASNHATNACTELVMIQCDFNALFLLSCIRDGSWPEEEK